MGFDKPPENRQEHEPGSEAPQENADNIKPAATEADLSGLMRMMVGKEKYLSGFSLYVTPDELKNYMLSQKPDCSQETLDFFTTRLDNLQRQDIQDQEANPTRVLNDKVVIATLYGKELTQDEVDSVDLIDLKLQLIGTVDRETRNRIIATLKEVQSEDKPTDYFGNYR